MNTAVLDQPETVGAAALTVRKARMGDIGPVLQLINSYAAEGIMLPRTEFEISEHIRDFTVVYDGDHLVATGALQFYSPVSAEVRSLAVDKSRKTQGIGRVLMTALEEEARDYGLHAIFAFTYAEPFFRKLGFQVVERGELPLKAWRDCLRCPKFNSCDEIAMAKYLTDHPATEPLDWADDLTPVLPLIQVSLTRK